MNYIDTQTADIFVLLHELGHTFEQYTRIGDPPALEPQSNILNPIWRNAIRSDDNRTSWYGNNNEWEDMAEFALLHAQCLVEGSLDSLEGLSPERFRIWERVCSTAPSSIRKSAQYTASERTCPERRVTKPLDAVPAVLASETERHQESLM